MHRHRPRVTPLNVEQLELRWLLAVSLMPLGDSISSGLAPADANRLGVPERESYRPALWDIIQAEFTPPIEVEFVGTTDYNPSDLPLEATRHSSYRGFWTLSYFPHPLPNIGSDPDGQINNNLSDANGWGTIHPDVALVQLGTNDILGDRAISSMIADLRRMVVELRADRPDVQILLGTLPPMAADRNGANRIPAANEAIRDLVHPADGWAGSTPQSLILIVDHYHGVGANPAFNLEQHIADGIHPNREGDALMAANWWHFLAPLLEAQAGPLLTFAQTTSSIDERGGQQLQLVVTRSGDLSQELTVDYVTSGDAIAGADYVALAGQTTFASGSAQAIITVDVLDDQLLEEDESLIVALQPTDGYRVSSRSTATITVLDDDGDLPTVSVAKYGTDLVESGRGIARFQVSRSGDTSSPLTVWFDILGSATAGEDYASPGDHIVIASGKQTAFIDVAIQEDDVFETAESIVATLRDDPHYDVGERADEITVADDENRNNPFETIFANYTFRSIPPFRMS